MRVRVKLFARARELAGADESAVEVESPATVAAVREALAARHPELAELLRSCLFAVDAQYAGEQSRIGEGAEVACIPPVSGG